MKEEEKAFGDISSEVVEGSRSDGGDASVGVVTVVLAAATIVFAMVMVVVVVLLITTTLLRRLKLRWFVLLVLLSITEEVLRLFV